jgi:predicted dithiol-disulfide oxidoreductase (DUF899 family)
MQQVVTSEEWLTARRRLLAQEKAVTQARDAVAAARRALPMVAIDKEYALTGPAGQVGLADLFEGRRQLIVHHFMWRFDTDDGCPSCSVIADSVGHLAHLHAADTTLVAVSRAPLASIERFRQRMGWTVPWYSSHGSDFNTDFHVTADGEDRAGLSVFLREGDRVFHTYSTYARGIEPVLSPYNYLDLTPLGRQLQINEFPHHDRYGEASGCHDHRGAR